jgi:hypothetical protein
MTLTHPAQSHPDKGAAPMGVIIRFSNCRALTKLEIREALREWYADRRCILSIVYRPLSI